MAGALDIRKETIRIRREQAEKNRQAVLEAEERRKEMGRPSDKRRRATVFPVKPPTVQREGHRLIHTAPIASLEEIAFTSKVARELAEEAQLDAKLFSDFTPSGKTGFTKSDVEKIIELKMNRSSYEDKMDRTGEEDK